MALQSSCTLIYSPCISIIPSSTLHLKIHCFPVMFIMGLRVASKSQYSLWKSITPRTSLHFKSFNRQISALRSSFYKLTSTTQKSPRMSMGKGELHAQAEVGHHGDGWNDWIFVCMYLVSIYLRPLAEKHNHRTTYTLHSLSQLVCVALWSCAMLH